MKYSNEVLIQMCTEVIADMQASIEALKDCSAGETLTEEPVQVILKCYDAVTGSN